MSGLHRYSGVVLWTLLIFFTVPIADRIQERVPPAAFTWFVVLVFIGAAALGIWRMLRWGVWRRKHLWVLLAVAGIGSFQAIKLSGSSPAEAIHYVEYGVLTVLWIRLGLQKRKDESVFLFALLITVFTGMVDECFQWILPDRVFDFRDMGLNAQAAFLGFVWKRFGSPVVVDAGQFRRDGKPSVTLAWSLICMLLALCFVNTPTQAAKLVKVFPALEEWSFQWGEMAEYGFLHQHEFIGTWKSRFAEEGLALQDRERAGEMKGLMAELEDLGYDRFLHVYSPASDPFVHEYAVHQFRLNRYRFKRNRYKPDDYKRYQRYCRVALMEHRIMQQAFSNSYAAVEQVLPDFVVEEAKEVADLTPDYRSPVSKHLILTLRPRHMLGLLFVAWTVGMLVVTRLHRS